MEEILHQAEQLEKEYDWNGATKLYEKALGLLPQDDFAKLGNCYERWAFAFYRFAFQAETSEEFKHRLRQSTTAYEKAAKFYERPNEPVKGAETSRCNAMISFIDYWLASEAAEKRRLLGECWRFTQEALGVSKKSEKAKEYAVTFTCLSTSALLAFCYEWNYEGGKKIIKELADHGEMGIKLLSNVDDPDELAKAYAKTAFALSLFAIWFLDLDEKDNCVRKAQGYWTKAKEAFEDSAILEMLCPIPGAHDLLWGVGTEEALMNVEKALEHARRTRDRFIIGSALDWLTYHNIWPLNRIDYSDEVLTGVMKVNQYAEDAKRQYSVISFTSPRADFAWVEAFHATIESGIFETDLGKRHDVLERAVATGKEALRQAETGGYPNAIMYVHHHMGSNLWLLAEIESSPEEKEKLLEEAQQHETRL
jgi:hypothetical protein